MDKAWSLPDNPLLTHRVMGDPVDHYHVLDVSPRASGHEIYDAYCRAVRHWLQTDSSFNHDILNRLQDSYRVLQNPYKRKDFHTENYGIHLPYADQVGDRHSPRATSMKRGGSKWKRMSLKQLRWHAYMTSKKGGNIKKREPI